MARVGQRGLQFSNLPCLTRLRLCYSRSRRTRGPPVREPLHSQFPRVASSDKSTNPTPRRKAGGTENSNILPTVLGSIPNLQLPACLAPQFEPHVVPSRRVPRLSSLALARIRQRLLACRIFTPAQPSHSAASSEGFLLRRLHPDRSSGVSAPQPRATGPSASFIFRMAIADGNNRNNARGRASQFCTQERCFASHSTSLSLLPVMCIELEMLNLNITPLVLEVLSHKSAVTVMRLIFTAEQTATIQP